ncbi:ATP-grasp domain-containing protein [Azospirillum endophyticum]|uniref:ATP-grasp domain-containing protein n=1 Tax=Azospirillum endophyticum TaxID=2800326 RepID=UPI001FFED69C|nr:ATP-grasp domain-containing protein [Azospirillum endophyticum]
MTPKTVPEMVVVALSARALAASACRGGRRVVAFDLFADADTAAMAHSCLALPSPRLSIPGAALRRALAVPELHRLPLVYGAGFEDHPDLLAALALDRPVIGNGAETVKRLKTPMVFAALLARLGIPHPEIAASPPADPGGWLIKRAGASGGAHIRPAASRLPAGHYAQRRMAGRPVSLLFLADGRRAMPVGFSRQWVAPAAGQPYRYGGAVGPLPPSLCGATGAAMIVAASRITAAVGLVGLNSADFLAGPAGWCLLEINPRPGATLDLFDRPPMPSLLDLHLAACAGELAAELPPLAGCRAAMVVYASAPVPLPDRLRWPDWTADRPRTPALIPAGAPLCTVIADGPDMLEARRLAGRRARGLCLRLALAEAA